MECLILVESLQSLEESLKLLELQFTKIYMQIKSNLCNVLTRALFKDIDLLVVMFSLDVLGEVA